jgi:hypothetical protein
MEPADERVDPRRQVDRDQGRLAGLGLDVDPVPRDSERVRDLTHVVQGDQLTRRIDEDPFLIMILVPSVIEALAPVLRSHRGLVVHRDLGQRDVAGELVELVSADRRRRDGDVGRPEVRHPNVYGSA